MDYKLGQKFVSLYEDKKAEVVAVRVQDEWQIANHIKNEPDFLEVMCETDQDAILFAEGDWEEEYITSYNLENYDSWDDDTDWTGLVTEEVAAKHKEVSDKIVGLLKEHNIDTRNLIVSDGVAYVGASECSDYIATTATWVPSSMQC